MHSDPQEEAPPFFKNWSGIYVLIVGVLVAVGLFLYFFTKHFE